MVVWIGLAIMLSSSDYLVVALLILPQVLATVSSSAVWAELYSGPGQTGSKFSTEDYIPDLAKYQYDDQAVSICAAGVWIVYEHHDYNSAGMGEKFVVFGNGDCIELPSELASKVTSIRQAGSPIVADRSSITLYAYTKFRGPELFVTRNWTNLYIFNDQTYSAIITGSQPWTVYTYDSYQGLAKCLVPDLTVTVGDVGVNVGLFPTYTELGSSGVIRSVQQGCHSEDIIWASTQLQH
ncbi:unnamed protein product [Meganyctiphanes norvegica]|uniref:Uncharacterized protein n=1 Tax=Meganyctiphanes norvegica TaxID=48144 RepID=A0AAV2RXG2_MEGNR